MTILTFERILAKNYINFRGKSIHKKYVLIESDDWGAQRTKNKTALEAFIKAGIRVTDDYFDYNDSLESSDDLSGLFEVLNSVWDKNGKPAVITPLAIVANPNFEAIKKNGFTKYEYESFTETYKRLSATENSLRVIEEGIRSGVYYPQFHGREHINVNRWLNALQRDGTKEHLAFEHQSLIRSEIDNLPQPVYNSYFPAFAYNDLSEIEGLKNIAKDGLSLFEATYGFKSISFCPSCGVVNTNYLESLAQFGIKGLQAGQHFIPNQNGGCTKVDKLWGKKSATGQVYWRRNCTFEPAKNHNLDWVDHCLAEIEIAFRWGKPAVINSHRVNYIGSLHIEIRDDTLRKLKRLLQEIVKRWPDVEFINSEQLCNALLNK